MPLPRDSDHIAQWARAVMQEASEDLNKLTRQELRSHLQPFTTATLQWMLKEIAVPSELYELCHVIREILTKRDEDT